MRFVIVLVALFALATARPNSDALTVRNNTDEAMPEEYRFSLDTSDPNEDKAFVIKGSYSHIRDDGQSSKVDYVGDENGFQPQGDHDPV